MEIFTNISRIPITYTERIKEDVIVMEQTMIAGYLITGNLLLTLDAAKKISDEATKR